MKGINYRGQIRRLMPRAIKAGMLPSHYLAWSKFYWGKAYRPTDFYADWREKVGIEQKRNPLKAIPTKYHPTEHTITEAEYIQKAKFNYNFNLTGYDEVTGEDTEDYMTVESDVLITMGEAQEIAEKRQEKYKPELRDVKYERESVTVRRP